MTDQPIHLVLFFTRKLALANWVNWGMLPREVALYRRLQERGVQVSFVTYGDGHDLQYANQIPGIQILCNRWRLPMNWYIRLLPWLHGSALRRADVFKTNQTNGADVALRAAQTWKKPLIARFGYMWSSHVAEESGPDSDAFQEALQLETLVFPQAQRVVVTAPFMAEAIRERIPGAPEVTVIPNYVDTEIFAPPEETISKEYDAIFIGRLKPQKNIPALLEAVSEMDIHLGIIGAGSRTEEAEFEQIIAPLHGKVTWVGKNIPNTELVSYLHRARLYILPSHYEGHPKTLIEAMACGLPVIGADVSGIRDVIQHGENGWLCTTEPDSIRAALHTLLADEALREHLGQGARRYALDHYALDQIVDQELAVLRRLAGYDQS
ncbi:MAG: glycosyltransferase family 4 protein [Anaerolineae bacterium]|nr:glycosyltransferase family 4 protein [Anaerolineae bacterium]